MGKITNPIEVFGTSTISSSSWMALEQTMFKQVEANQPSMFCVAAKGGHHLVDGLVAVLLNMLKDPRSQPFCVGGKLLVLFIRKPPVVSLLVPIKKPFVAFQDVSLAKGME